MVVIHSMLARPACVANHVSCRTQTQFSLCLADFAQAADCLCAHHVVPCLFCQTLHFNLCRESGIYGMLQPARALLQTAPESTYLLLVKCSNASLKTVPKGHNMQAIRSICNAGMGPSALLFGILGSTSGQGQGLLVWKVQPKLEQHQT